MLSAWLPQVVTYTHTIILTDSVSLLQKAQRQVGSPGWYVSMVDIYLRKLLWVYCPGHVGVEGNDRLDRLEGKAIITSGLRLGRFEVLRSWRDDLGTKILGHHTIDGLKERSV